jgi:hypothetical protein
MDSLGMPNNGRVAVVGQACQRVTVALLGLILRVVQHHDKAITSQPSTDFRSDRIDGVATGRTEARVSSVAGRPL